MIEKTCPTIDAADADPKIALEVWEQPKKMYFTATDMLATDDEENTRSHRRVADRLWYRYP